jgi:ATP-binding cassette subfamily F protein uup
MRRMPQARGHKAKYREDAFYELERVAKQRIEERQIRLKASNVYIGTKIFECQYISKAFRGERSEISTQKEPSLLGTASNTQHSDPITILKDFYYNFSRFEKMGIVGNNGTGKSTFIKMLLGQVPVDEGRIIIGDTVRFGYFSQEGLQFNEQQKVIDVIRDIADYVDLGSGRKLSATQLLQYFLFTPEQQYNYVYKLSGGERRKLYLCTVLMCNPNFLVLDEPTNDLDIVTLQILEEYLQDFPGCVIVVSHDRYFMDKVVDHLLVFKGQGVVKDFPGNYTQYREWVAMEDAKEALETKDAKDSKAPKEDNTRRRDGAVQKRKLTYKEKLEMGQLEKDIEVLEAEKKQIEEALCGGTTSVDEITAMSKRLPLLNNELDEKSMRWLELSDIER